MPAERRCPECRTVHKRPGRSEYCSNACKAAFHNRRAKRGALLYDLEMLITRYPARTVELVERRDLTVMEWFRIDAEAGRVRTTRKLMDVTYDDELLRSRDVEDFLLQSE